MQRYKDYEPFEACKSCEVYRRYISITAAGLTELYEDESIREKELLKSECRNNCRMTGYQFYNWLIENGYQIRKAVT